MVPFFQFRDTNGSKEKSAIRLEVIQVSVRET